MKMLKKGELNIGMKVNGTDEYKPSGNPDYAVVLHIRGEEAWVIWYFKDGNHTSGDNTGSMWTIRVKDDGFWGVNGHTGCLWMYEKEKGGSMITSVIKVYEKTSDAVLVDKWAKELGVGSTFVDALILRQYSAEILAEAIRLEKESEDKKTG